MKTLPKNGYLMTDRDGNIVAWFSDFMHATEYGTAHGSILGLTQHYLGEDSIPAQHPNTEDELGREDARLRELGLQAVRDWYDQVGLPNAQDERGGEMARSVRQHNP